MSFIDAAVIWGNLLGCVFAIGANLVAAHVGFLIHRGLAITIALIGSMYATGYLLLLSGHLDFVRWSAFFRGVSVIVWPVVWAGPALMSIAAWRHTSREVRAAVEEERDASASSRC